MDRTPCILCPSQKVQNPDFYVEEFDVSCQEAYDHVEFSLPEYGTEETCGYAKIVFPGVGCICEAMQDSVDV